MKQISLKVTFLTVTLACLIIPHAYSQNLAPSCGISIGTVEAVNYVDSGLDIPGFSEWETPFIAYPSDGIILGFGERYEYDSETGESFTNYQLNNIYSTQDKITIPDYLKIEGKTTPVTGISFYKDYLKNIKSENFSLTIPSTVNYIYSSNYENLNGCSVYMLGDIPEFSFNYLNDLTFYICNKDYFKNYVKYRELVRNVQMLPYGWDFEWVTVNVNSPGEFADLFLKMNNNSWSNVQYVKITGNVNDIDIRNVPEIEDLYKLDISETKIQSLPSNFMSNRNLNEIKLPKTLELIGQYAFYECPLKYLDAENVTRINHSAFNRCNFLESINLPRVEMIENYVFYDTALKNVSLPSIVSIGDMSFADCHDMKSFEITESVNYIGTQAFMNSGLESITIPSSITDIENSVFYNCDKLRSITLPKTLQRIMPYAFYNCKSLETLNLPASLFWVSNCAFDHSGLKKIECESVTPPRADYRIIGDEMDMTDVYLYVPSFSIDKYRNDQYWSAIYHIEPLNKPVDFVWVYNDMLFDSDVMANDLTRDADVSMTYFNYNGNLYEVGALTAEGSENLSIGKLEFFGDLFPRNWYDKNIYPTLINNNSGFSADAVENTFALQYYRTWYFISLPYDVKVSEIIPSKETYWTIRRYNSQTRATGELAETWENLTSNDIMEGGKGYILSAVRNDGYIPQFNFKSFNTTKNNIFRSGDANVVLTQYPSEFAHNQSWNFLGNPYPCYYDMSCIKDNFTSPITIYDGSSYKAYSADDDELILAPYESFFVQAPEGVDKITFGEEGRMHHGERESFFKKPQWIKENIDPEGRNVFNFIIEKENYSDMARIVLNPASDMKYEIGKDASKFFVDESSNAEIYVSGHDPYSIDERPLAEGKAYLGIKAKDKSQYTIRLEGKYNNLWKVVLTDKTTGNIVDLTDENYTFFSEMKNDSERFVISFELDGASESGIENINEVFSGETIITVTSLSGKVVYKGKAGEIKTVTPGIYIITDGAMVKKAILK